MALVTEAKSGSTVPTGMSSPSCGPPLNSLRTCSETHSDAVSPAAIEKPGFATARTMFAPSRPPGTFSGESYQVIDGSPQFTAAWSDQSPL